MKTLAKQITSHSSYSRVVEWGKLISITGSAQIAIQALSLLSGIFVIRLLPTKEYALYTLANTMLGTITVIADGGIATGVMTLGGKVWQSEEQLGAVIATGLDLRKRFAAIVLLFAVPILLYLLYHHSHNWLLSGLIVASLIPAFFSALSGTLLEIAPRLHQDIKSLQKIEVGASLGRLLLMVATLFFFPFASIAILSAGLPQILANRQLRKISTIYASWSQPPVAAIQKEIMPIVKRVLPGALYYCVSGQITIWLISFYGSTESVAQIGALGRLTMILNVFSTICSTLIIPRFARLQFNKKLVFNRFIQVQLIILIVTGVAVGFITLFPSQALLILGKNYSSLTTEIILMTMGSCLSMAGGITYSMSVARGWVLPPAVNIGVNILTQVILLYFLDLSKVKNVIVFSITNSGVAYFILLVYFILKVSSQKNSNTHS
jgi:O-antigen/teichoic acid export membrane protein